MRATLPSAILLRACVASLLVSACPACGGAVAAGDADGGADARAGGDAAGSAADATPGIDVATVDAPAPVDAGSVTDAADDGAAAALVACEAACATATGGDCPVLLLYSCLMSPCGDPASTSLCGGGDGHTWPSVATIECAQAALPACQGVCQGDSTCKAFVACIVGCSP